MRRFQGYANISQKQNITIHMNNRRNCLKMKEQLTMPAFQKEILYYLESMVKCEKWQLTESKDKIGGITYEK